MKYQVKVEPLALADIQEITDWYNGKQFGLGKRFQTTAINQIDGLDNNPHVCTIRYKEFVAYSLTSSHIWLTFILMKITKLWKC